MNTAARDRYKHPWFVKQICYNSKFQARLTYDLIAPNIKQRLHGVHLPIVPIPALHT